MFYARVLSLLTLLYLVFLHHSILIIAVNFPTPNSSTENTPIYGYRYSMPKPWKPVLAFGRVHTIATVGTIVITLLNIFVYKLRQLHEANLRENLNIQSPEQPCRCFSLADVLSATHNFDEALVIGKGGFGKVYKGVVDNGATTIAIKRLNPMSKQGAHEFWTEIKMLSKIRHSHIVSLIGYCNDCHEMILVYEYMVRGTLADNLHKSEKTGYNSTLCWVQRLKICIEAARGLDYLHTGTGVQDRVIHRDVKSSNILLDENWAAKISDFGLSKIGPANQSYSHVSTNVKGTFGYVDMEYFLTHQLTRKSDVYAFGVVLFEVLCGRPAVDLRLNVEQRGLAGWAQRCIKEGMLDQIIDPTLRWQIVPKSLVEFVRIANKCLHSLSKKRPSMAKVVVSLERALELQQRCYSSMSEWEIFDKSGPHDSQEKVNSFGEQQAVIMLADNWVAEPLDNNRDGDVSKQVPPSVQIVTPNLKMFTLAELKTATGNFRPNMLLGEGCFRKVYIGWVDEMTYAPSKFGTGMAIAVKKIDPIVSKGFKDWQLQRAFSRKFSHSSFVNFLGYCFENKEVLLVYEYMEKGSLESHLFESKQYLQKLQNDSNKCRHLSKDVKPLPWFTRLKIAIGAARGLAFLHATEEKVNYIRFKTRDILLDGVHFTDTCA
ncbi:hypothetical protein LguiB_014327 [Lonicera macranthoides]